MKHDDVTPYGNEENKNRQVARMFDNIAKNYDLLNTLLSAGIHKGWRKKCVRLLREAKPKNILYVATGTGDFAIACASLSPDSIVGIDISEGMLEVGRKKVAQKGLDKMITLQYGNAENEEMPTESYDAIVVGFGVRNFQDLEKGLKNLHRLLRHGGQLIVLEFSYPRNMIVRAGYSFYFSYITPVIGKIFSKDTRAYSYLTESVKAFPDNENFTEIMGRTGFKNS